MESWSCIELIAFSDWSLHAIQKTHMDELRWMITQITLFPYVYMWTKRVTVMVHWSLCYADRQMEDNTCVKTTSKQTGIPAASSMLFCSVLNNQFTWMAVLKVPAKHQRLTSVGFTNNIGGHGSKTWNRMYYFLSVHMSFGHIRQLRKEYMVIF